nr:hypothetical protein CFP56_30011 [Quercus suber]
MHVSVVSAAFQLATALGSGSMMPLVKWPCRVRAGGCQYALLPLTLRHYHPGQWQRLKNLRMGLAELRHMEIVSQKGQRVTFE